MKKILLVLPGVISLCACQTNNSTTNLSLANVKLCEDAGLKARSSECATYVQVVKQRAQQEHLLKLQQQGVPVQYEECVFSLPINIIYKQLSIKMGVDEKDVRALVPESALNDYAKCTCSEMIYGGLMPEDAIRNCQTTVASKNLNQTDDTYFALCSKNTFNEIYQEYKKQNIEVDEETLKTKYSKNITDYCHCVFEAKEDILRKYQSSSMPQKVRYAERAAADCAEKYLKSND